MKNCPAPKSEELVTPLAQSASTLGDLRATRKRQSRHKLVIGNLHITSLKGKEHELIEEAKRYSLDAVAGP